MILLEILSSALAPQKSGYISVGQTLTATTNGPTRLSPGVISPLVSIPLTIEVISSCLPSGMQIYPGGSQLWSTSSYFERPENISYGFMNHSWNFVLKRPDDETIQESFAHPNDTTMSIRDNICLSFSGRMIDSGACGYNSICSLDENKRPICACPQHCSLLDPNYPYGSCKPDFHMDLCDEQS